MEGKQASRRRMLKLVNRTPGVPVVGLLFAWTFLATLPLVFLLLVLRIFLLVPLSLRLSFSLFFLRVHRPLRLPRGEPSTPDSVAPTMEGTHCLRGLSLPSIAKYTPASPPDRFLSHPFSSCRVRCFLSSASSPTFSDSFRVACRVPFVELTVTVSAPASALTSLDRGHARSEFMSSDILSERRVRTRNSQTVR